jgi:hypothetical protein
MTGAGCPRVRVVVLNYNGRHLIGAALDALRKLDWPSECLDVVLVDNASTDGTVAWAREAYPEVRVIESARNLGYASGNNLALRDLDEVDYVALLNNDAMVEPGWLRPLVAALEADATLGAACSKVVFAPRFVEVQIDSATFTPARGDSRSLGVKLSGVRLDGIDRLPDCQFAEGFYGPEIGVGEEATFQWTRGAARLRVPVRRDVTPPARCELRVAAERVKSVTIGAGDATFAREASLEPAWIEFPLQGKPFDVINNVGSMLIEGAYGGDRGFRERDDGQYEMPAEVFAWCGSSVLLSKEYLADAGLLDDRFFLYYEDFDLSWRGRMRGWRYLYVPQSVVRHVHAASSVENSAMFQHFVERNRLLMLTKNAPAAMAAGAVAEFLRNTMSYARRDILSPVMRGHRPNGSLTRRRLRSFLAYLELLPRAVADRRRLRRRQVVDDAQLVSWMVTR